MRIVFFGTPQFASNVLEELVRAKLDVVAVISRTDKPKGRSGTPVPTPVKEVAIKRNIPVYQPEKVSSDDFRPILDSFNADMFVVVAYGEILKQHVLDAPKLGCINVHASLLPKYRGAAPIQQAIINGDTESGISIMYMVKKMDAGDVISKTIVPITEEMNFAELEEKLCIAGSQALLDSLKLFEKGKVVGTPQNESEVTFAPKIELEDCQIDWSQPAKKIHDRIRGVNPYPGAWTFMEVHGETKRFKIFSSKVVDASGKPGVMEKFQGNSIIYCGEKAIQIIEVQLEGKKRMLAEDLFRGVPIHHFRLLPNNKT